MHEHAMIPLKFFFKMQDNKLVLHVILNHNKFGFFFKEGNIITFG